MSHKTKYGGKKYNHVCVKHGYSSKCGGLCPTCREPLKCIGDRWRIGHCGQFEKVERKTRKLAGQEKIISFSARSRIMKEIRKRMASAAIVQK